MMLKSTSLQNRPCAQHRARATAAVVRCSATAVEPDASAPRVPRNNTAAEGAASPRTTAPAKAGTASTHGFRRAPGAGPDSRQQQQQPKTLLPSLNFLDDDTEFVSRKAREVYQKGSSVVVRCLGRQGVAGAMRFMLALRELGNTGAAAAGAGADADAGKRSFDLQVRLVPQEPLRHFGTPLMMFVTPVRGGGRTELPGEGSETCKALIVSSRTGPDRLAARIHTELEGLKPGHFLRLDMVGTEALFRGLMGLSDGLAKFPSGSGSYFAVPELVSVPLRVRQQQDQQQQEGAAAAPAAAMAVEAPAADAAATSPAAALGEEPTRVQVLRLYLTRDRSAAASAATAGAPAAAPAAAAAPPADSPQATNGGDGGSNGKVLVSEAELAELRGALGNMMEQQKLLVKLIGERQAAGQGQE